MNAFNHTICSAKIPGISFQGSEKFSVPQLDSPVLILLKTDHLRPDELARLGSFLSEKEIAKSLRFRFPRDKVSYIVVHGLLRWILGKYLGISPEAIEINYNSFGKPFVSGSSPQVFFNLSHSSGISALAFDPENEIGVDVERINDEFEYESIVQTFFTREEGRYIQHSNPESRNRFYEIWTRKEAFLKAVGTGITEHLQVEVLKERIKGSVVKVSGSGRKDFLFRSIVFEQNFRITLAMSADSNTIRGFVMENNKNGLPTSEA